MSEYKDINVICNHCGMPLEAKPDHSQTLVLSGCEPMKFRHIHDKSTTCVIELKGKASPYSTWGLRDKYYEIGDTE